MWSSYIPTAFMAILLLSGPASARRRKRPITVDAFEPTSYATDTLAAESDAVTGASETLVAYNSQTVVVITSTVTVSPVPASSMLYSETATGSGAALTTGYLSHNNSGNLTIPFFSVNNTATPSFILAPSSITSASLIATTSDAPTPSYSTASTTFSSNTSPDATSTSIPFLRGVNLGGWLVLEEWMDSDIFTGAFASAVDQITFDSIPGAAAALETHWSTFFTEEDIQTIAATGINALRIPIGYWAYNNTGTPYIQGADAYLEQAIGWARNASMKIWVDCHGSPGSQNGFQNSGQQGEVNWQQEANLEQSISVLKTMAAKYGAQEYADVVVGLELINEPISWANNVFSVTQSWAQEAYMAVKAEVENDNMVIVMHDAFEGPLAWTSVAQTLNTGAGNNFGIDTHLYQLYTGSDNTLTQAQHITEACGWAANLSSANAIMPTYVGEWSAATNICVNPNGTTTAGTSCSVSGCQCQSEDFADWNADMIEEVRKYVEAQLDVFESSTSGYFLWAAKGPGGWGFLNGIGNGAIPNPITSRLYPAQCGSTTKGG